MKATSSSNNRNWRTLGLSTNKLWSFSNPTPSMEPPKSSAKNWHICQLLFSSTLAPAASWCRNGKMPNLFIAKPSPSILSTSKPYSKEVWPGTNSKTTNGPWKMSLKPTNWTKATMISGKDTRKFDSNTINTWKKARPNRRRWTRRYLVQRNRGSLMCRRRKRRVVTGGCGP